VLVKRIVKEKNGDDKESIRTLVWLCSTQFRRIEGLQLHLSLVAISRAVVNGYLPIPVTIRNDNGA
jgi:hypothetical protein